MKNAAENLAKKMTHEERQLYIGKIAHEEEAWIEHSADELDLYNVCVQVERS